MKTAQNTTQTEDPLIVAVKRLAANPPALRLALCLTLALLSQLVLLGPMGSGLAESRAALAVAEEEYANAEIAVTLTDQLVALAQQSTGRSDASAWQEWILRQFEEAGVELLSLEPLGAEVLREYRVLEFEISGRATAYADAVELVGRLEYGDRIVRFTNLRLIEGDGFISLSGNVLGLVDEGPSAAPGFRDA